MRRTLTRETIAELIRKYAEQGVSTRRQLSLVDGSVYRTALNRGMTDLFDRYLQPVRRWTFEELRLEVEKLGATTRSEIWKTRPDLAAAIWRAGLSDQLLPPSQIEQRQ